MITLFTQQFEVQVLSFALWQFLLVLSLLASLIFVMTSEPERPPRYQPALAFLGFVISVGWIYLIANEIVSLLKAIGVFFGISDAILGLTVLAWGNSIGDMVADIAIAKQGKDFSISWTSGSDKQDSRHSSLKRSSSFPSSIDQ